MYDAVHFLQCRFPSYNSQTKICSNQTSAQYKYHVHVCLSTLPSYAMPACGTERILWYRYEKNLAAAVQVL